MDQDIEQQNYQKKYYKIAQEYLKDDKPAYYYADKYNISQKTFYNYLHEKGLAKITANYNKQTCDENFFKTINSEEKAYWLGFIFADGSVNNKRLIIELSDIDVGHLIKFKKDICATNNIYKRKNRPTVKIEICKKNLVKDLAKYGCIKNKTYNGWIDQSLLGDEYKRHFLRGFLDGDGYIERKNYKRYRIIYTVWSENIKNTIMDMLSDFHPICRINNPIKKRPDLSVFRISIERKKDFFDFLEYIYMDSHIYLDRKYYTAMARLHARPESLLSKDSGRKNAELSGKAKSLNKDMLIRTEGLSKISQGQRVVSEKI